MNTAPISPALAGRPVVGTVKVRIADGQLTISDPDVVVAAVRRNSASCESDLGPGTSDLEPRTRGEPCQAKPR